MDALFTVSFTSQNMYQIKNSLYIEENNMVYLYAPLLHTVLIWNNRKTNMKMLSSNQNRKRKLWGHVTILSKPNYGPRKYKYFVINDKDASFYLKTALLNRTTTFKEKIRCRHWTPKFIFH